MTTLQSTPPFELKQAHNRITLLLLLGLLFLRLPFLALARVSTSASPQWLPVVFELGTYLLTVGLVWWERGRLADFHIDGLVLAIIIFLKPTETLILAAFQNRTAVFPLAFPSLPALAIWIAAIGLFVALLYQQPKLFKIQRKTFVWFLIGIVAGLVTAILLAYPISLQLGNSNRPDALPPFTLNSILIQGFVYQLGYAAVTEEPLFRGFLWGYLHNIGWRDIWIWLFQAGLFWLGHFHYFGRLPISFWFVPVGALILGALAWRSRSIATSMAAHAAMNGLITPLAYVILFYQR